ncbi:MAG: 2OG-Fe(II) oxygenase family protein [Pseudomonadota bacterium]
MPWDFNSLINGRTWVAEPEKLAQIGEERIAAMAQIGAEDQFRWAHDNIMPNEDDGPRERRSMQLATLYKEWTTEDAVAIWNTIMPDRGISGIAIKASRFRPGHFLTPHDDADGEKRVVAIVLSLNPEWEPHWGGQLQLEDNQGALQVLSPEHNVLHMFTVPRRHFVSQVATYAPRGRIAISGWLTRD